MTKKKLNNRGQFLLETLVALGVIIVGLLSVFGFIGRGLSTNRVVADQFTGAYLAAEGVEIVKNIVGGNSLQGRPWNSGISDGNFEADYTSTVLTPAADHPLKMDATTGAWGYNEGKATNFTRTIHIDMLGADEIRVNSRVSWSNRGGSYNADVEDHFYNWKP